MTFQQNALLVILVAMLMAFAVSRVRIEIVALSGLALAYVLGVIPAQEVFSGLSSPAVITVVEILLIVGVLSRAQIVERVALSLADRIRSERALLFLLCGSGAAISVFMNNIGALALMFPVALSTCARMNLHPARVLMPLSFATLIGGICSLTGTPANLVVNDFMIAASGGGFAYFETGFVGFPVAFASLTFLVIGAPALLRPRDVSTLHQAAPSGLRFVIEAVIGPEPRDYKLPLEEFEKGFELAIHGVLRAGKHVFARRGDIALQAGDVVVVQGSLERLQELVAKGILEGDFAGDSADRRFFVVMPDSVLQGSSVGSLARFDDFGVQVLGLATRRSRFEGQFADLQIDLGDVLELAGDHAAMDELAADSGLMALSLPTSRSLPRPAIPSLLAFGAGVAATALEIAPPQIAFGAVVVAMILLGRLDLRTAFQNVNWPIIILLACMVPLGMAVESTGSARLIANGIVGALPMNEPLLVIAVVLALTVTMTPFVDNVSTVAVMSPIASEIASRAGVPLEPMLIAVAAGASLDFLTPFGHHNNAVVMGAAGYRLGDFLRLGFPLLLVCYLVALGAIGVFWGVGGWQA